MADTSFDPDLYTHLPLIDTATALTFGRKLAVCAPRQPPAAVKKALGRLKTATDSLQSVWTEADRLSRPVDRRPVDNAADVAWGAFHDRLDAYARLPHDRYPRAARAATLRGTLFPTGTAFLGFEYDMQWAEMHKRVDRINDEKLQPELEAIAGPDFVADMLRTYADYGAIVGITPAAGKPAQAPSLIEPLRALIKAATSYGRQLTAWHDDGDDEVKARVGAALGPFDDLRANQLKRGNGSSGASAATTPAASEPAAAAAPAQAPTEATAANHSTETAAPKVA